MLKKAGIIFDRLLDFLAILACVLLSFTALSVGAGICSRYFFGYPLAWVTEVNEDIIIYVTFMAAAWILRQERHVKMDMVITRLNERAQAVTNFLTSVFCAIVCLVLSWYALKVSIQFYNSHTFTYTVLELPKCIFTFPISLGSFLLFIQFVRRAYSYLNRKTG